MSVTREVITGADVPSAIGPYSPAVRAGDLLFGSGQPGVDPATAQPVGPTFGEQARQAFQNLDAVLREGSSGPEFVVNTTVLLLTQAISRSSTNCSPSSFPTSRRHV